MGKTFEKGDWVAYQAGPDGPVEIGRVTEDCGESAFVCYSSGCTAASTPKELLSPIRNFRFIDQSAIGHHRFDDSCPEYTEEACDGICPEKAHSGRSGSNSFDPKHVYTFGKIEP